MGVPNDPNNRSAFREFGTRLAESVQPPQSDQDRSYDTQPTPGAIEAKHHVPGPEPYQLRANKGHHETPSPEIRDAHTRVARRLGATQIDPHTKKPEEETEGQEERMWLKDVVATPKSKARRIQKKVKVGRDWDTSAKTALHTLEDCGIDVHPDPDKKGRFFLFAIPDEWVGGNLETGYWLAGPEKLEKRQEIFEAIQELNTSQEENSVSINHLPIIAIGAEHDVPHKRLKIQPRWLRQRGKKTEMKRAQKRGEIHSGKLASVGAAAEELKAIGIYFAFSKRSGRKELVIAVPSKYIQVVNGLQRLKIEGDNSSLFASRMKRVYRFLKQQRGRDYRSLQAQDKKIRDLARNQSRAFLESLNIEQLIDWDDDDDFEEPDFAGRYEQQYVDRPYPPAGTEFNEAPFKVFKRRQKVTLEWRGTYIQVPGTYYGRMPEFTIQTQIKRRKATITVLEDEEAVFTKRVPLNQITFDEEATDKEISNEPEDNHNEEKLEKAELALAEIHYATWVAEMNERPEKTIGGGWSDLEPEEIDFTQSVISLEDALIPIVKEAGVNWGQQQELAEFFAKQLPSLTQRILEEFWPQITFETAEIIAEKCLRQACSTTSKKLAETHAILPPNGDNTHSDLLAAWKEVNGEDRLRLNEQLFNIFAEYRPTIERDEAFDTIEAMTHFS